MDTKLVAPRKFTLTSMYTSEQDIAAAFAETRAEMAKKLANPDWEQKYTAKDYEVVSVIRNKLDQFVICYARFV